MKIHIMMPGRNPATNRRPMETSPTVPYRIRPMEGGIVATISPDRQLIAAAQPGA